MGDKHGTIGTNESTRERDREVGNWDHQES